MMELNAEDGAHGFGPKRLAVEKDRMIYAMQKMLAPTVTYLASRKNMMAVKDDVDQHAAIAICKALSTWIPEKASFSTHVHWQIMAELGALQHALYPDRRKLKTPQRIRFVELDKPYREGDDSATMIDMMPVEGGEEDVESGARRNIAINAIERIFSHYVAKQMQAYCINQDDLGKIAKRRETLMRNRWIYMRRRVFVETFDTIGKQYGISRERVRQIVNKIEIDLRGHMPTMDADDQVIEATRRPPEEVHPCWAFMLSDFHQATGADTRIVGQNVPMPERIAAYDFRPTVEVCEQTQEEMLLELAIPVTTIPPVENTACDLPAKTPRAEPVRNNVVAMAGRNGRASRVVSQSGIAFIAGAMLTGAVAANAQSRAIPPEMQDAAPATSASIAEQAPSSPVRTEGSVRRKERPTNTAVGRTGPLVAMSRISVDRPSWAVKVSEYPTLAAARAEWPRDRGSWTWLHGLYPGYLPPEGDSVGYGVAYGPLNREQASGVCHEAARLSKPCTVVGFGQVGPDSGTSRKGARRNAGA